MRKRFNDSSTATSTAKRLRCQSGAVIQLASTDGDVKSGVHLVKLGAYQHAEYGSFAITQQTFNDILRNFNAGTYGQKIFVDVAHKPEHGAAAEITRLYQDGEWLKGDLVLTEYGRQSIAERKFIYLSVDYTDNWQHPETAQPMGAVLFGAGLTIRPFIKGQPGIALAESGKNMKFRNQFLQYLASINASAALIKALSEQYDEQVKALTADTDKETLVKILSTVADVAVKQLAEQPDAKVIQLHIPANPGSGLTKEDVERLLAERENARQLATTEQAKKLAENKARFQFLLAAAQGLSDDTRHLLAGAEQLISADMSENQIKLLADQQLKLGDQMEVNRKLSAVGYHIQGTPHISVDDSNNIKSLQETVRKALQLTDAHASNQIKLEEKPANNVFLNKVLAEFDRKFAYQLQKEHRILSGAQTNIGTAFLPASFQREVIREALSDLNILQLVRTSVDPTATITTQIPYEDHIASAAAIPNGGIVYEGQEIGYAGVGVEHDVAYVMPLKLALKVTDEVMQFSRNAAVNWEAWGENIASNARIMRELIHMHIANEMLRASDTYMSKKITNESFTASADGLIKTIQFPVVRPFQTRDLKSNVVGNPECPITIIVGGGNAIPYFTGEENLPVGTYWRFANLNLGYIQLVNQFGAVAGAGATGTISYSTPGNIVKFDLKPAAGVDYRKHLNYLLGKIGDQKAVLTSQRYVRPDYSLMSEILNNEVSKAEEFVFSLGRQGTNTNSMGDLDRVKGLPTFGCNAPGMDIGDQRILLGPRNITGYTVIKPYSVGQPFEAVGPNGRPTGEMIAYGTEYMALHTPKPVRNRYTSVLVYDSTTR